LLYAVFEKLAQFFRGLIFGSPITTFDCCRADDVYKLWRIFNALAETSDEPDDDEAAVPVTVHADEAELLVQRLGVVLRTAFTFDAGGRASNFTEFLRTIEVKCLAGKNTSVMSSAVGELYDDIIANVLKKVDIGYPTVSLLYSA